jgi:hypothetical protein
MQPYFLPYIGYWQLLSAVDTFVVYDNIQYTKRSWINRNRFLVNGEDRLFTIPLTKDSDTLDVRRRCLAADFRRDKLVGQLEGAYGKAPYAREALPVIAEIIRAGHQNLFDYVANSIRVMAGHLGIATPLVVSSTVAIDHSLRAEHRVLALCKALGADHYLNAIGGQALYGKPAFAAQGIELGFVRTRPIVYPQFGSAFVPNLSIVDVLMFNHRDAVRAMLGEYDLV